MSMEAKNISKYLNNSEQMYRYYSKKEEVRASPCELAKEVKIRVHQASIRCGAAVTRWQLAASQPCSHSPRAKGTELDRYTRVFFDYRKSRRQFSSATSVRFIVTGLSNLDRPARRRLAPFQRVD